MNYKSRLLSTLDQALARCTDRSERSRLLCRQAIHHARLDEAPTAATLVQRLRAELNNELDPVSATWILLAESFMAYFEHDLPRAYDRVQRSHLIAKSASLQADLAAPTVWLAQIAFRRDDLALAASSLLAAQSLAAESDHFSRCRIAMVAADMLDFAGEATRARLWIKQARAHATAEGDESSIAAILYNTTMHRLNFAMIAHAFGEALPEDFAFASKELQSARAFGAAFAGVGLPEVRENSRGHVLVIEGKFGEAIQVLRQSASLENFSGELCACYADLIFSAGQVHDEATALEFLAALAKLPVDQMDPDASAFTHARLASYHRGRGNEPLALTHAQKAQAAFAEFKAAQQQTASLLADLRDPA